MRRMMGRYHSAQSSGGGNTVSYGPLLDQSNVPNTGVFFALGLRLLRAAYTGNCLKVQRSSDNATQDIGFNGDGSLNTAAIATFCGSSPGFVNTWYDQSGSAANFVARTTANTTAMYRIYTGTAIETVTTISATATAQRPCVRAVNTSSDLVSTAFTAHTAVFASFSVVSAIENTVTPFNGRMLSFYGATNTDSSDNAGMSLTRSGSSTPTNAWNFFRNPGSAGPNISATDVYSNLSQVDVVANGANYSLTVDNGTSVTATTTSQAFNFTTGSMGWSGSTHNSVGEFTEAVAWNVALSATNLTAIRTNQSGYWNTPGLTGTGGSTGGGSGGSGGTDLPGWKLVMDEGFDTPASSGQFLSKYPDMAAYANGTKDTYANNNGGSSQYRTDNITCANSIATVKVYCDASGSYGAAINPIPPGKTSYHAYLYLRDELKVRALSPVSWQKLASLLWSDANVWNEGEMDWPEANLNGTVNGFNHWPGNPSSQDSTSTTAHLSDGWHSFVREWTNGNLKYILDGTIVHTFTTHIATTPFHPIIQCERVLSATPAPVQGQSSNLDIDYYRMWIPA